MFDEELDVYKRQTQGCEMRDKFKQNFLIVLPAAIITTVIFLVLARSHSFSLEGAYDCLLYTSRCV